MSIHVSVGLAQAGTPDAPKKAIRIGLCTFHGQQDAEALLSVEDARMLAALLTTACDNIKATPFSTEDK